MGKTPFDNSSRRGGHAPRAAHELAIAAELASGSPSEQNERRNRGMTRLVASLTLAAATTYAGAASGQIAVVGSKDLRPVIDRLEVARTSNASARETTWFRLKLTAAEPQDWMLIAVVRAGDRLDLTSAAWFEALRETTAPRLLPPEDTTGVPCGQAPKPDAVSVADDLTHEDAPAFSQSAQLLDVSGLLERASSRGIDLQNAEWAWQLSKLEQQGARFVVLPFSLPAGSITFPTLRLQRAADSDVVPLLLNGAAGSKATLDLWLLAGRPLVPMTSPWATVDAQSLLWNPLPSGPETNYARVVGDMIADAHGDLWVIEASQAVHLASDENLVAGLVSVPSVGRSYLERWNAFSGNSLPLSDCLQTLASIEDSTVPVAPACAPGQLATVADSAGQIEPCSEPSSPDTIPAQRLRCDQADDLALAFAGTPPSALHVTRWTGILPAWGHRVEQPFEVHLPLNVPGVQRCAGWDGSGCDTPDAGAGGAQGSGGTSGTGGRDAGSSVGATGGGPSRYENPGSYEERSSETYSDSGCAFTCWGTPADPTVEDGTDDSTCSGDSSGSSDDSSCSGDSSGSNDDATCSGDSSDSGDDSTCSGDSSGSNDDSSCSGDSSDGGDTETCNGDGSDDSDCAISNTRRRRRKIPSLATAWLFALLVLPLRRWQSKRRRNERSGRS